MGPAWFSRFRHWVFIITDQLWFWLLAATVLCLPFHKVFPVYPLILAGMAGLLAAFTQNPIRRLKENAPVLITILLYLPALWAWYLSVNKDAAVLDLQVKFSLWLFPLIAALNLPLTPKRVTFLLRCMVLAVTAFIVTAFAMAIWDYINLGLEHFTYKKLVGFTIVHPSYIGMYVDFGLLIILTDFLSPEKKWLNLPFYLSVFLVLLLLVFLLLLTAKNALLLAVGIIAVAAVIYVRKTGNLKAALSWGAVVLVLTAIFILFNPVTRERLTMLFLSDQVDYENSVNARKETWMAAVQVLKAQPWYGSGSGDAQPLLSEQYKLNGFQLGFEENHNAHNQYLQVLLESGWPGLMLTLACFIWLLYLSWRRHAYLFTAFLALFLFSMSTESMLEAQGGVIFITLFNCIFLSSLKLFKA